MQVAAAEGTTPEQLTQRIQSELGSDFTVRTGVEQADEESSEIATFTTIIRYFLLSFAGIALFVGAFVIFNTLSITVAQRMREFATLRTLGASRRQVLRSVILEALVIGLGASIVGLFGGLGARRRAERALQGAEPRPAADRDGLRDADDRRLAARRDARDAGRRSLPGDPRDPGAADRGGSRGRDDAARALRALHAVHRGGDRRARGARARLRDARRRHRASATGSPCSASASSRCSSGSRCSRRGSCGRSCGSSGIPARRIGGAAGKLAEGNAQRNPGRTAATAAALMIGIALVTFVSVLAQRPARLEQRRDRAPDPVRPDRHLAGRLLRVPGRRRATPSTDVEGVETVSNVRQDIARDRRRRRQPDRPRRADQPRSTTSAGRRGRTRCSRSSAPTAPCCRTTSPRTSDLAVGDTLTVRSTDNETKDFVVRGIYEGSPFYPLLGTASVSQEAFDELYERPRNRFTLLNVAGDATAAKANVESALESFPDTRIQTRPEWIDKEDQEIQQFLLLLYVLLALSVIISLFGMVNTLALSVFERTRELGMLRAVGMTRRQTRRMIRHESVITALIGAALGLPLGIFLAALVTRALGQYDMRFDAAGRPAGRARDRGRRSRGSWRRSRRPAGRRSSIRSGAAVRMTRCAAVSTRVIRFALKGLLGRKLRTALTAFAIVLGVAMVSGTFVLTDSIDKAFDSIFTESRAGSTAVITGKSAFDISEGSGVRGAAARRVAARRRCARSRRRRGRGQRRRRGAADRGRRQGDRLRRRAEPRLLDRRRRLGLQPADPRRGRLAGAERGGDRQGDGRQGGLRDRQGDRRAGRRAGRASAHLRHLPVRLGLDDRRRHARGLRPADGAADLRQGRQAGRDRGGRRAGRLRDELVQEIENVLPPTAEVKLASEQAEEDAADTNEFITFLQGFLLAFAGIALFVGSFVIANSLSITIAQRTREFATIRTLGGSRRQVLGSIVVESLVVGTVASIIGLISGLALAKGLFRLFDAGRLHAPEPGAPAGDADDRRLAARRDPRHAPRQPQARDPGDPRAPDRGRARRRDAARVPLRALPHRRVAAG